MLTIHFVAEGESQPVCRRPDRREWMWAADPSAVTCPSCAAQLAAALERPEGRAPEALQGERPPL